MAFFVCKYFGSNTDLADAYECTKMITAQTGNKSMWWLRSGNDYGTTYGAFSVDSTGLVGNGGVDNAPVAVRPAFVLKV